MKISARERRLLALLGVVAGLALLRWVWSAATTASAGGRSPRSAATGRAASGQSGASPALPSSVVEIESWRLEAEPRPFAVGRDLFHFAPPPPPPPPSAAELERARLAAEARRRQAEEAARQAAIPRPPEFSLSYLGSFGPERKRIAVFRTGDGANVLNALEGDVLEGKFVVRHIGFESVDIGFVAFPDAPVRRIGISE